MIEQTLQETDPDRGDEVGVQGGGRHVGDDLPAAAPAPTEGRLGRGRRRSGLSRTPNARQCWNCCTRSGSSTVADPASDRTPTSRPPTRRTSWSPGSSRKSRSFRSRCTRTCPQSLIPREVSISDLNLLVKHLVEDSSGCVVAEGFAWSRVEFGGDRVELELRELREVGASGEVLAQESVGVLVGAALPGGFGVAEVNFDVGRDRELGVFGHLHAAVLGERGPQLLGQATDVCAQGFRD